MEQEKREYLKPTFNDEDIKAVVGAVRAEANTGLGAWRENMVYGEFAEDPIAYIEENATPLEAPFEVLRYAEHFAADEGEKDRARRRAVFLFQHMLARRTAQGGKDVVDKSEDAIWSRSRSILVNHLEDEYSVEELRIHFRKPRKMRLFNI